VERNFLCIKCKWISYISIHGIITKDRKPLFIGLCFLPYT
jgi:hypothetical protein